eukprot:scaffold191892_cov17-Tisochrysis_lutea.AAC.3
MRKRKPGMGHMRLMYFIVSKNGLILAGYKVQLCPEVEKLSLVGALALECGLLPKTRKDCPDGEKPSLVGALALFCGLRQRREWSDKVYMGKENEVYLAM